LGIDSRRNGAVVGDLVNLKQFKKRSERMDKAQQADSNRVRFGRTKAEKQRDELTVHRASATLDQHRIDDESAS
jgi:Domain of unknown function (DUF4169)